MLPERPPPSEHESETAKQGAKVKKFEAFIYPNPINVTSRLYLSVHEKLDLNIMIHEKYELLPLRSGSQTYAIGKHAVDLKLHKLAEGNYQLKLLGLNQLSILDFEVG